MINATSATNRALSKEFTGVLKENAEKITFNLQKNQSGILNKVKIDTENVPVYNYAYSKGLDMEYFKDKMSVFCSKVKDGAKLFEEIMKYGLNLK